MLQADGAIDDLFAASRADLAPAPFPPRRDLAYATYRVAGSGSAVLFHDAFWPQQTRFSCYVARLDGGNLPRNLAAAHFLKSLLRAALRTGDADDALRAGAEGLRAAGAPMPTLAAAALALHVDDGHVTTGAMGPGAAVVAGGREPANAPPRPTRLDIGGSIGLALGDVRHLDLADEHRRFSTLQASDGAAVMDAALTVVTLRSLRATTGRTFALANDVAKIGRVLDDVVRYLVSLGLQPDALLGLDVALDELLTNTILYAYRDGGAHEIILEVRLRGDVVAIEILDDGAPFDPTRHEGADTTSSVEDRPIGGLGLHFVRSIFDALTYRRIRGWNALSLTKALGAEASAG